MTNGEMRLVEHAIKALRRSEAQLKAGTAARLDGRLGIAALAHAEVESEVAHAKRLLKLLLDEDE